MKYLINMAVIGLFAVLFVPGLQAETADDCITMYEEMKADFDIALVNLDFEPNCTQSGNVHSLFTEGELPSDCDTTVEGSGGWDHWHLEARASVGNDSHCTLMLRGLVGQEGCGMEEEIRIDLPANEAVKWRKYLQAECE